MSAGPVNAFIGKTEAPTAADLEKALGGLKPLWDGLIAEMAAEHGVSTLEWKSYSIKYGWSLRLLRGKRTILWLAPLDGHFLAMLILGDRAMKAARQCGLSARALRILDEAPKYPEGTGIRLLIKGPKDLATVRKLVVVKLEN